MSTDALRVFCLSKHFGSREILHHIDLDLPAGRCLLLSGANGAGKTTLLRILAGLEKPESGIIDTGQGPLPWRRCRKQLLEQILYLHQQPYMFDGSVRYNLAYALPRRLATPTRDSLLEETLAWAGLEHLRGTPAKSLSGGERQRVSLARAWLRRPRILLLDEPTASLDQESRQRSLQLLTLLKESGMSLIMASHDPHHLAPLVDSHLQLRDGRLLERAQSKIIPLPLNTAQPVWKTVP